MKVASGHVINLLANDIHKLDTITPSLMHFWIAPIFFVVSTIFVWNQMQVAGIIGIAFLIIVLIPLNGLLVYNVVLQNYIKAFYCSLNQHLNGKMAFRFIANN